MSEPDVDYEGLDRLLSALAEGVASRVHVEKTALSGSPEFPETLPAAWQNTTTAVQVDTLPRGVELRTVFRGVLGHFLPAASVVVAPLALLTFVANPLEYILNLRVLSLIFLPTLGFAVGLGALSPWLYPHSNPDGRRSEVVGFISPFACSLLAWGLAWLVSLLGSIPGFGWLLPLLTSDWIGTSVALVLSGMALAVITYAPWLRRTSRIASPSPPGRWRKLRAVAVTGGLGAVLFGPARVVQTFIPPVPTGIAFWPELLSSLAFGASFGFLIGLAFALAMALVYRRYSVGELRAWKVGLWAAAAAILPLLVIAMQVVPGQRGPFLTLGSLMQVFVGWNLPGFLMGYGMVKLAQRSGPTG